MNRMSEFAQQRLEITSLTFVEKQKPYIVLLPSR